LAELEPWYDVDDPASLGALIRDLQAPRCRRICGAGNAALFRSTPHRRPPRDRPVLSPLPGGERACPGRDPGSILAEGEVRVRGLRSVISATTVSPSPHPSPLRGLLQNRAANALSLSPCGRGWLVASVSERRAG